MPHKLAEDNLKLHSKLAKIAQERDDYLYKRRNVKPDKSIVQLYKDINRAKEGKLFKSAGRGARVIGISKPETMRMRAAATSASVDVRAAKTLAGEKSPTAEVARIRQKAALRGVEIPSGTSMGQLGKAARRMGRIGIGLGRAVGKLSAVGQLITLPGQVEEYKEMRKPLHKREAERGGIRA